MKTTDDVSFDAMMCGQRIGWVGKHAPSPDSALPDSQYRRGSP
jgi:hypothetical protein